jgi:cytoskeletal protein CcmA (bactofilin family)
MWNKQSDAPSTTPSTSSSSQQASWQPQSAPVSSSPRPSAPATRTVSSLGSSIEIKGKVTGDEDLQIDGKVEGSVVLNGQRLTVGRTGQLNSEVWAREVVVYGKLTGNVHASDRVEIKKDGSVTGDITTARISVEDGAYFKGRIEIERSASRHASSEATASASELVGATN